MPVPKSAIIALLPASIAMGSTACLEGLGGLTGGDAGPSDTGTTVDSGSPDPSDSGGGGSDGNGGQDGDSGTGPTKDASSADVVPPNDLCPVSPPATGASCTQENVQCEYGSAWWSVACDTVLQCEVGHWTAYQPSTEPCSTEPGQNGASCPANYASAEGNSCVLQSGPCVYSQAECLCQAPVVGQPGDGGTWACLPQAGCPFPRPNLGTMCTGGGSGLNACKYEVCTYEQVCTSGLWQAQLIECAAPGVQAKGQ
jgi:hypothetical protein